MLPVVTPMISGTRRTARLPRKIAALTGKAWAEAEAARSEAWTKMAAAEDAQDDYSTGRQAQAAAEFGEMANDSPRSTRRVANVPGIDISPASDEVAAFKQQLHATALPDITSTFLLSQGWTQDDLSALVQSMVSCAPDEYYETLDWHKTSSLSPRPPLLQTRRSPGRSPRPVVSLPTASPWMPPFRPPRSLPEKRLLPRPPPLTAWATASPRGPGMMVGREACFSVPTAQSPTYTPPANVTDDDVTIQLERAPPVTARARFPDQLTVLTVDPVRTPSP